MGGRGRPLSCCPYGFEDKGEFKTSMLWRCYFLPAPASLVFLLGSLYKPLVNHWGRPTFILKTRPNIKTFSRLKRPPNPSRETPKNLGVTGFAKWDFSPETMQRLQRSSSVVLVHVTRKRFDCIKSSRIFFTLSLTFCLSYLSFRKCY